MGRVQLIRLLAYRTLARLVIKLARPIILLTVLVSSSSSDAPLRPVVDSQSHSTPIRKLTLISKRVLRRIMATKESLFKFGIFVPRNDREAESSPEASRWKAGRDLE
jgi:hypothetical protein